MNTRKSKLWHLPTEELRTIVSNSPSFSDVLRTMGMFSAGANINTLQRRLRRDGIDFSHISTGRGSTKGKKFLQQTRISLDVLFTENSKHSRRVVKNRILKDKLLPLECALCGASAIWMDKPLTLVLDHINGIPNDHRLENLRLLCPNCNSQTETFCGRNQNSSAYIIVCPCGSNTKNEKFCSRECNYKFNGPPVNPPKIKWPSHEELQTMVADHGYSKTGRLLGVSDTAVRKHLSVP